ncbi:mannose-6-phosphate isomerase [Candidatus Gillettellia adelgis]
MQQMINPVHHYAWGSCDKFTKLFGITRSNQQPIAELWMGAHSKSPSYITDSTGRLRSLRALIDEAPSKQLGVDIANRFGQLPFLLKVLCADQPLSIQVHPSKTAAETGYAKENAIGIPMNSAKRNFKDPNHKPELVFALTPFLAMNGFRTLDDIVSLVQPIADAHQNILVFLHQPDIANLFNLFASLLAITGEQKARALAVLKIALNSQEGEPWETLRFISGFYPQDNGLFSPLMLNLVQLQPGEAMFLHTETPHSYLKGGALEVMANSDNVLRAGLTTKYIDIPQLLANLQCHPQPASALLAQSEQRGDEIFFPIPVEDFAFSLHKLTNLPQTLTQNSAAILFCINGKAVLKNKGQKWILRPGKSCFIGAFESPVSVSGQGHIARVYNQIP